MWMSHLSTNYISERARCLSQYTLQGYVNVNAYHSSDMKMIFV